MLGRYLDLGNPVADHPLNQSLVSWWLPLPNNQGGSRLFDLRGGNHGTLTNGPTWTAGPSPFGAVQYDGSDDYVAVTLATALSAPLTIETYERLVGFATQYPASVWSNSGLFAPGLTNFFGGPPYRVFVANGTYEAGNSYPAAGGWVHRVTVYAGGAAVVYLNGVQVTSVSYTPGGAMTSLRIGGNDDGFTEWQGPIQSCRLYSRALPASDVWSLYDQSRRGHPDTLRRWTPRVWSFGTAGGGAITGTLAATLAGATVSSAGALAIAGTLSRTLDGATLSSAGTLPIVGTASATLAGATLAATGALAIAGSAAVTLDGATLSATGTLAVSGSLAATLAGASLSSAGALAIAGSASNTLAGTTVSSTGVLAIAGTLSATLDGATLSAAGGTGASGSLAVTLAGATLSSTGALAIAGSAAVTLAGATLSSAGALALAGALARTLAGATLIAVGGEPAPPGTDAVRYTFPGAVVRRREFAGAVVRRKVVPGAVTRRKEF